MSLNLQEIPSERITELLEVTNMQSLNQLWENIGLGNKMPFLVAKLLNQDDIHATIKLEDNEKGHNSPLIIKGTEGMVVTLAKCCHPIPGDHVIGFFNPGRGIVVHHHECRNRNEVRKKSTNWLDIEWSERTR